MTSPNGTPGFGVWTVIDTLTLSPVPIEAAALVKMVVGWLVGGASEVGAADVGAAEVVVVSEVGAALEVLAGESDGVAETVSPDVGPAADFGAPVAHPLSRSPTAALAAISNRPRCDRRRELVPIYHLQVFRSTCSMEHQRSRGHQCDNRIASGS
ncbi:hypothetical protein [Cumulibacter manganitolerans]|uniref:hypothetical protein n=1 Tax=Cumulibacter manganitolerans TaxID=1884992 RepID=UPI00188608EB|nr:hypothetical protein [Cumulibacter manganitolerans]